MIDLRILFIGVLESPEHISDPKRLGLDFKKLQSDPKSFRDPFSGLSWNACLSRIKDTKLQGLACFSFHGFAFYRNLILSNKTDKSAN